MPILNYTTTLSTERTVAEIQEKLARAGAQAVLSEYDPDGIMCALSFRIQTQHGMIFFRLPANKDGVHSRLMEEDIRRKYKTEEQAARVAWRILKDWIEAQLAIVEAEMASMAEVFLPYAQDDNGTTVYQMFSESKFKLLTHDK